jgi:hypothetical protein
MLSIFTGVCDSVDGRGSINMSKSGRLRVQFRMALDFAIYLILQTAVWLLGLTQPLKDTSTRNLPGYKGQSALKTDNLTAICKPIF